MAYITEQNNDSLRPKGLIMPLMDYLLTTPALIPKVERLEGVQAKYPDVEWIFSNYYPIKIDGSVDLEALADHYLELVIVNHVEIILGGTGDSSAIIHSYLAHHCPWLKASSVESVMLCNSKFYTRQLLVPDEYNIRYTQIPLDTDRIDVDAIIEKVHLPMILKPNCGWGSAMIHICHTREELIEAIDNYKSSISSNMYNMSHAYGKLLLNMDHMYSMTAPSVIAEEYIDTCHITQQGTTIHCLEFCMNGDEVTSWGVTDDIYWPSNPQVFLGCGVPSMSSMKSQIAAREMMESVAGRLKRYGFTGFCNIEYFAFEDGSIKLMEINPRMFYQNNEIDEVMKVNGDKLRALIDIQKGIKIPEPTFRFLTEVNAPKYGIATYVSSFQGGLVADLFNFKLAMKIPKKLSPSFTEVSCRVLHLPHKRIACDADSAAPLAFCYLYGDSFQHCMHRFKPFYHRLLKHSSYHSLWEDFVTVEL